MTLLPSQKEEGDKMECPDCGMPLRARLKTYKDNAFPAYVQWQNEKETTAHKTPTGECKDGTVTTQKSTVETPSVTVVENTNPTLESILQTLVEIKTFLENEKK